MEKKWFALAVVALVVAAWMFRFEVSTSAMVGTVTVFDRWTHKACIASVLKPGTVMCDEKALSNL